MASSPSTGDTDPIAQGLRQKAVLAAEMQVDDALAEAGLLGHGRDRRVREAAVGDAPDGGQDQLLAALFRGCGTAFPQHRQLSFRAHKKACLFSKLSDELARTETT
jgi:hypothetical protein